MISKNKRVESFLEMLSKTAYWWKKQNTFKKGSFNLIFDNLE
jgi:hypothetical protein